MIHKVSSLDKIPTCVKISNDFLFLFCSNENVFMTFQSKEPIISIPMQEKHPKEKVPGSGGGHGHGISVEHPTS